MTGVPSIPSRAAVGLEVANLSARYEGANVVEDVSFAVRAGELVTLLGPSGCGKSTTLRCVAGLHRSIGGTIKIGDERVAAPGLHIKPEMRRINMVFQSYAIWPHMTVADNVAYGLRMQKVPAARRDVIVGEMLELVGLAEFARRPATGLSGGQQQRVALARALATRPRVLLLDEPLSNLDTLLRARMRAEIQRIQKETGTTTLYVTHDCGEALSMSNEIVLLEKGRIAQIGRPEDLYDRPSSRFVAHFLGDANFVRASVVAIDHNFIETVAESLDGAPRFLLPLPIGSDVRVGQLVDLVVRPERLAIGAQPSPDARNAFTAQLMRRDFFGNRSEVTFRSGSVSLRCEADREFQSRMNGDTAVLSIAPDHLSWVPVDGAGVAPPH